MKENFSKIVKSASYLISGADKDFTVQISGKN